MATVHLEEMGTERPPIDMDFPWFGVPVKVAPTAGNPLLLARFAERAAAVDALDDVNSMLIIMDFLKGLIDESDWDVFMDTAAKHNQQVTDLMEVAKRLVVAVARFPIGPPSDSSNGRPSTNPRSRDGYYSAVATAMAASKGRPDIKMIIWQAHQARTAHQAAAG